MSQWAIISVLAIAMNDETLHKALVTYSWHKIRQGTCLERVEVCCDRDHWLWSPEWAVGGPIFLNYEAAAAVAVHLAGSLPKKLGAGISWEFIHNQFIVEKYIPFAKSLKKIDIKAWNQHVFLQYNEATSLFGRFVFL